MPEHHDKFPPSSMPALECCPRFTKPGTEANEAMMRGTRQHDMLAAMLTNTFSPEKFHDLTADEQSGTEWAFAQVLELTASNRLVEQQIDVPLGFEVVTFGHADILQPPVAPGDPVRVIDFKSGRPSKDYEAQIMAYAIGAMVQYGTRTAECWLIYGEARCMTKHTFALPEAQSRLKAIIDAVEAEAPARPCEFCDWCAHLTDCPAVCGEAVKVVAGYEERPPFDLATYHASQIDQPDQMAKALALADILAGWAESVKHHAKDKIAAGMVVPGWHLSEPGEKQFIDDADIPAAFAASGLTAHEFLSACTVSLPKLRDAIAPALGFKTGSGKKVKEETAARLGALLQTSATTPKLERDRAAK